VLLFSSLLNAAYFMPVVYRAFFCSPEESAFEKGVQEAPLFCVIPLVITAAISILLLIFPQPFFKLAGQMAARLTGA
jgi:multicomponent Na+:H+ antiporter subunit D